LGSFFDIITVFEPNTHKIGFVLHKKVVIGQLVFSIFFATENEKLVRATEFTENTEKIVYKVRKFTILKDSLGF